MGSTREDACSSCHGEPLEDLHAEFYKIVAWRELPGLLLKYANLLYLQDSL